MNDENFTEAHDGRRERGNRNRAVILAESVSIASTQGIESLTMGSVAAAAGVPKSTLQVLFKDRQSLQLATIERGAAQFEAEVGRAIKPSTTPLGQLIAMVDAWFDVVQRKVMPGGCLVTAAATEFRLATGMLRDAIDAHRARWRNALLDRVEMAIASNELGSDVDAEDLVFEIMAFQAAANSAVSADRRADFARARRRIGDRLRELSVGRDRAPAI